MFMFTLDPQSLVHRAKASGQPIHLPTLGASVTRGMIGFTLVSLGGFAPWVLAGRWFYRNVGEIGLYVACAIVFIGLSGALLHRLIIGPGSLRRFYQIFSLAFVGYATAWTIGWMAFGGLTGSIVGALGGIAVMGGILAFGFGAHRAALKIFLVLFAANAAGYFIGEWAYNLALALKEGNASGLVLSSATRSLLSKSLWGFFYGLGFGAGIGATFYLCQTEARHQLQSVAPKA
jgi:hypothetical protein